MSLNETIINDLVEFKGSKNGIVVNIKKESSYDDIKSCIIYKLESAVGFFNGAKISTINCDFLSDIQIMRIKEEITSRFDVEFIEDIIDTKITYDYKKTKYVNSLRSGVNIEFDGDIVVMTDMSSGSQVTSTSNVIVMGNVESGAKVIANGNIIVMGYVKGFIYAGADGNENAYTVAKIFRPQIVQIANNIAEAPDDDFYEDEKVEGPEIAFLSEGRIVVENYIPKVKK